MLEGIFNRRNVQKEHLSYHWENPLVRKVREGETSFQNEVKRFYDLEGILSQKEKSEFSLGNCLEVLAPFHPEAFFKKEGKFDRYTLRRREKILESYEAIMNKPLRRGATQLCGYLSFIGVSLSAFMGFEHEIGSPILNWTPSKYSSYVVPSYIGGISSLVLYLKLNSPFRAHSKYEKLVMAARNADIHIQKILENEKKVYGTST